MIKTYNKFKNNPRINTRKDMRSMNKELIKISTNEQGKKLVSARELHKGLEIKTQFTKWFIRMCEYGFDENSDYTPVSQKRLTG